MRKVLLLTYNLENRKKQKKILQNWKNADVVGIRVFYWMQKATVTQGMAMALWLLLVIPRRKRSKDDL